MSMRMGGYKVAGAKSKSREVVKYVLYVILSGAIAYYMKEPLTNWAEEMNVPFSGDALATFASIALGLLITTMMLYFYERSMMKNMG